MYKFVFGHVRFSKDKYFQLASRFLIALSMQRLIYWTSSAKDEIRKNAEVIIDLISRRWKCANVGNIYIFAEVGYFVRWLLEDFQIAILKYVVKNSGLASQPELLQVSPQFSQVSGITYNRNQYYSVQRNGMLNKSLRISCIIPCEENVNM